MCSSDLNLMCILMLCSYYFKMQDIRFLGVILDARISALTISVAIFITSAIFLFTFKPKIFLPDKNNIQIINEIRSCCNNQPLTVFERIGGVN